VRQLLTMVAILTIFGSQVFAQNTPPPYLPSRRIQRQRLLPPPNKRRRPQQSQSRRLLPQPSRLLDLRTTPSSSPQDRSFPAMSWVGDL